ncbi:hypothetical protein FKM82_000078 [Ascaphus truei]
MDNGAFEMQGEGRTNYSPQKMQQNNNYSPSVQDKRSYCSLMRIFLVCFLACLITTAIGVLILSLVYVGHFSPQSDQNPMGSSTEKTPSLSNIDSQFNFLNHLSQSKVFQFEGGATQWARFRNNPLDYSTQEERKFGDSINSHQAKMTVGTLRIASKGLRAPSWVFNANVHGFVVQGSAWVGVIDDGGSTVTTYNVTVGQVIFLPKNILHWMKNVGDVDCLLLLFFTTHDEIKFLDVDDAFFLTPEDIASRSLKPEGGVGFIRTFQKQGKDQAINLPQSLNELIQNATYIQSDNKLVWRYFYDLKGSKEFLFPGGIIQWARYRKDGVGLNDNEKIYSESLNMHADSLTLGTLLIYSNGLRQPHFHFNAHEMGYVISGCAQIGIAGDEPVAEFSVGIGDVFFFPLGTQHYIKSTCEEDLLLILAFSTGNQLQTLDMDDYFHATADHILAQLFLKKQEEFKKIPRFADDQAVNIP